MIFRYAGGKARFRPAIMNLAPAHFTEYREPLVGGGAIFFGIPKDVFRWINDKDESLVAVYKALQDRPEPFIHQCRAIKPLEKGEGQEHLQAIFDELVMNETIDTALRYYFLNRTSWSGIPFRLHHGPSFTAPEKWRSVMTDRLWQAAGILQSVRITAGDYLPLLQAAGDDVWIYADPPYYAQSMLPNGGQLYRNIFTVEQHIMFAEHVKACPHKVLLSYDDHPFIHNLYADPMFRLFLSDPQRYQLNGKLVRELFITNYS